VHDDQRDSLEILRELYPELTDEQLAEVRDALDDYIRLVIEISENDATHEDTGVNTSDGSVAV